MPPSARVPTLLPRRIYDTVFTEHPFGCELFEASNSGSGR
jgi:hypothetical protein